jgi:uncharacterized membrane protein/Asp-tRNA(Asn)/Glu-tRNA(Gln) amidotransferase A subunit family amidase
VTGDLVAPRRLPDARGPGAAAAARRRVDEVEDRVRAWVELVPGTGEGSSGPLGGVPVGVKDIVDVAGVPTRCGSSTRADAPPAAHDAGIVAMLREAGAVVVGKTVTTEFAFFDPGPTRNPWDLARTPGGSSSGSAAAVAAGAVPLAVGTQTAGSVVRPASFCGVAGLAVARGSLPTDGVAPLAPGLDTLGLFAATVADLAEARAALGGPAVGDAGDAPRLATWDGTEVADVTPAMREAHARVADRARAAGFVVEPWPVAMHQAAVDQRTIMAAEAAATVPDAPGLGPKLRELLAEGRAVPAAELAAARERSAATRAVVLEHLAAVDAVLAPGALGVAPAGIDHTGDPAMSRPWHVVGLPALAVPGARDVDGLPLGLQLLGHPDREDSLLATGRRLERLLRGGSYGPSPGRSRTWGGSLSAYRVACRGRVGAVVDRDGGSSGPGSARSAAPDVEGLDTDFQVEFEQELEHHHLWHREGQRHHFGGDSPLLAPRVAALVRYVPRAHPAGFVLGTAFALTSLTPSLLPRTYLFQGLATGISGGLGYGLGVALAWLVTGTARWTHLSDRVRRATPVWFTPGSWLALVLAAVGGLVLMLVAGAGWQRQVAALMGVEQPSTGGYLRAAPVALVVAGLIVGFGRGVLWLSRRLADVLRRRVHVPRGLATVVATGVVVALVVTVADSVVLPTGLRIADAAFSAANDETYPGVTPPSAPTRSGSPASLVRWPTLGREGQDFVADGPPLAALGAASGRPPVEPIRAYVGLLSAPTPDQRASLAVAELERTGAFARPVIAVVTTTGTGWIDDPVADSLEMIWGGDTAIVATQYSYLPSWLSFLVDRSRAQAEGRALFDAVHARIARMPPAQRPRLYAFGESLGSLGSEAAFSGLADARARTDGVLWVGPPNANPIHAALTARRDPRTPEYRPVVDDGREVRFGPDAEGLASPPGVWSSPHVVYLQHASDPVVWWSPALLWRRPDWLTEPRGPDVADTVEWYPLVTFWQVTIDLTNSTSVPDGHGHQYRRTMLGAWLALGTPPGWTDADATRVAGMLGP